MGVAPWVRKYSKALLRLVLGQAKGPSEGVAELLPPSLKGFDKEFEKAILSIFDRSLHPCCVCPFCNRPLKSKKGLYLHVLRRHYEDYMGYVADLVRAVEESVKRAGVAR